MGNLSHDAVSTANTSTRSDLSSISVEKPVQSVPSVIGGPLESSRNKGTGLTAQSAQPTDLFYFLRSQEKSLKCSTIEFFNWLQTEDIVSLADLVEAFNDEECAHNLVANGLKKFKLPAFRKAVAAAKDDEGAV